MIPDVEDVDPVIDFSWYYAIGKVKLGLSFNETGRLTITLFNKLYAHYKDAFDLELRLRQTKTTYADAYRRSQDAQEWF